MIDKSNFFVYAVYKRKIFVRINNSKGYAWKSCAASYIADIIAVVYILVSEKTVYEMLYFGVIYISYFSNNEFLITLRERIKVQFKLFQFFVYRLMIIIFKIFFQ